ncbi:MAG: hypothetical protein ABJI45_16360 [Paracoccaceae bacterium]
MTSSPRSIVSGQNKTPPAPRPQPWMAGLVFLECVAVFSAILTVLMVVVTS